MLEQSNVASCQDRPQLKRPESVLDMRQEQESFQIAIARALDFLGRRQLPHGEFATLLGSDRNMSCAVPDGACFVTAHMIYSLTVLGEARATPMVERAAAFLRSEQCLGGVWRYWSSRNHKHARLGPDLDDTACASDALRRAGFEAPRNLWAFWRSRDQAGRFYTWILPKHLARFDALGRITLALEDRQARARARRVPTPQTEDPRFRIMQIDPEDVDPVVNANVVLYLGERQETEAALAFVIETASRQTPKPSLYYEDPLALYHAVAKSSARASPRMFALGPKIVERLQMRLSSGEALDPLKTALAAAALSVFAPGDPWFPKLLSSLLRSQRADGGWKACAFYNVWGSEELTTGFALESLARGRRLGVTAAD